VGGSNGVGVAVIYWAIFTYALVFAVFAAGKYFYDVLLLVRRAKKRRK
jgi:succinate-acetate transporter protein